MRLVSFGAPGSERPGALLDDTVVDLLARDATLPGSVRDILAQDRLDAVRAVLQRALTDGAARLPVARTRLGPPVTNPSKIICIGLNYADHAAEQKRPLPATPLLFAKAPSALCGAGDPILLPPEENVDVEAELAVVVGKRARHVRAAEAEQFVAGYMCFNDVSGRTAQFGDRQWFRGKSYDSFAPCGPWLVSRDEIPDPHDLAISSHIGARLLQESRTSQLVFRIPELLEYITRGMTLWPGDIVATGTPAGVGVFREPQVFLCPGDQVSVTIEGLGTLTNPVRAAPGNDRAAATAT